MLTQAKELLVTDQTQGTKTPTHFRIWAFGCALAETGWCPRIMSWKRWCWVVEIERCWTNVCGRRLFGTNRTTPQQSFVKTKHLHSFKQNEGQNLECECSCGHQPLQAAFMCRIMVMEVHFAGGLCRIGSTSGCRLIGRLCEAPEETEQGSGFGDLFLPSGSQLWLVTFAQISTYCPLTVFHETSLSQPRSTLNQISDAFSRVMTPSLLAHVGSIFNECAIVIVIDMCGRQRRGVTTRV